MRCRIWMLLLGVILGTSAQAQVKLELVLRQKQYLINETLPVGIRVVNLSGQTLNLTGGDWLSLTIEDMDGFLVKQAGSLNKLEDVVLESSYEATQWLDIVNNFDFQENDRYTLRGRLDIRQWGQTVQSEPVSFEIIRGTRLWEQKVGIPSSDVSKPPEVRRYVLQQANRLSELQMYLRITNEDGSVVYSLQRLAPMMQINTPEAQIDVLSRLHVLIQISMRNFAHIVVNPEGEIVQRQTYEAAGIRPSLKVSKSGSVYVSDGRRLLRTDDIPQLAVFSEPIPEQVEPPAAPVQPKRDPYELAQEALQKQREEEVSSNGKASGN